MMMPYRNPDDYVSVFENHSCLFHKIAPGEPYAGCTCSGKYYQRLATPEERKTNIANREAREKRHGEAMKVCGMLSVPVDNQSSTQSGFLTPNPNNRERQP